MARVMARPRAHRLMLLTVLVAGLLVPGAPALACSCAPPDLASSLPEADGAFVGRWLDRVETGDGMAAVTFEVERVVKGAFGPKAIVRTNAQGSACGLERLGGSRTGLLLQRGMNGVWESNLCSMVPAAELLAFGGDRPPDTDVAAVGAGWSLGFKGLLGAIAALVVVTLALVWFTRRRRAATTGVSNVA